MTYKPELSRVSVSLKTFLRNSHLEEAVTGILSNLPECQIIIADDGDHTAPKEAMYESLRAGGHLVIHLPFDSGFGAKSNAIAAACERDYLLIGSDDFDFAPRAVRGGVEALVSVLDGDPEISIASGRVNNYRYEGRLIDNGTRIREEYISFENPKTVNGVTYFPCDITVNYCLVRRSILGPERLHWIDSVKIGGGEHGMWFLMAKRLGYRVAYVPGVNICEQVWKPTDLRYGPFRRRAQNPARPAFVAMGVREYTLFGGQVEHA